MPYRLVSFYIQLFINEFPVTFPRKKEFFTNIRQVHRLKKNDIFSSQKTNKSKEDHEGKTSKETI